MVADFRRKKDTWQMKYAVSFRPPQLIDIYKDI